MSAGPRLNVALLAACQALFMTSNALLVSTSALVGMALAPEPILATLPLGCQFLATMVTALPASLLMRRVGRRAGLMLGAVVGVTGALLCTRAILDGRFELFAAGTATIGVFNGFAQFYRFAAADAAPGPLRGRAIALVMAGGIVAAFTGPNLARLTRDAWAPHLFAGSYVSLVGLYVTSLALLFFVAIPRPAPGAAVGGASGGWFRDPRFGVAVFSAMVGYGVMNVLMTATPLAMLDCGFVFDDTAFIIQWHVLAMFAPSFVTGRLIERYRVHRVMMCGALLLLGCVAANIAGTGIANFWLALVLLGIGWNFLFVGATTLVVDVGGDADRARAQGVNELLVFGTVAMTAFSSGALHHTAGWTAMNLGVVPFVCAAFAASWWLLRRGPRVASRPAIT